MTAIVVVYAPTEVADGTDKDLFYRSLEGCLNTLPPHSVKIVIGDLNACIGADSHTKFPRVVGRNTCHDVTNSNGSHLVELCCASNMRVVQSFFPHRGRLWTLERPSGKRPQLDHILISGKRLNSARNCRAYSTVEIDSDHRILSMNLSFGSHLRANDGQEENEPHTEYTASVFSQEHPLTEAEMRRAAGERVDWRSRVAACGRP